MSKLSSWSKQKYFADLSKLYGALKLGNQANVGAITLVASNLATES